MTASFRTIGFPTGLFRIRSGSFDFENFQTGADSFLSMLTRVGGLQIQLWAAKLEFVTQRREGWQELQSFRAKLAGQLVLFEIYSPAKELPLGAGAGYASTNSILPITGTTISGATIREGGTTALVKEAAPRYAQDILLKGLKPSARVLRHGDHFGLGGNLYMCVANVNADANGEARVPFRWRLWRPAEVNDIVTLRNPTCRVQLRSPNEGTIEMDNVLHGECGFSVREVPYT